MNQSQRKITPADHEGVLSGIYRGLLGVVGGQGTQYGSKVFPGNKAPEALQQVQYSDDLSFCQSFSGLNILVTGATGTIGSAVVEHILRYSRPANLSLFVRDD